MFSCRVLFSFENFQSDKMKVKNMRLKSFHIPVNAKTLKLFELPKVVVIRNKIFETQSWLGIVLVLIVVSIYEKYT